MGVAAEEAMAMTKLISRVMKIKMKHLVDSISVKKLHTHSISNPTPISLLLKRTVFEDRRRGVIVENILSILKNPKTDTDVVVENMDLPYLKNYPSFEICGRTHGMVCLADQNQNIMVGNPATCEFRTLPPSIIADIGEIPINPLRVGYDPDSKDSKVRLGYDPKSKDFRVIRVFNLLCRNRTVDQRAEVYSLSTGRWTEITIPKIPDATFEICHKGIYYWWSGGRLQNDSILTFDFTHGVFRMLPVPVRFVTAKPDDNYYQYGLDDLVSLTVWNGSIVLIHNPHGRGDEKYYDIWAMDDVWVSWSKVLTIGPLSGVAGPLLFVNSDELLMEAMDGNVISYNVITKELKNLPMKGIPMNCYLHNGCMLST